MGSRIGVTIATSGVEDLEEELVCEVGLLVLKRANGVNERLVGARGDIIDAAYSSCRVWVFHLKPGRR